MNLVFKIYLRTNSPLYVYWDEREEHRVRNLFLIETAADTHS